MKNTIALFSLLPVVAAIITPAVAETAPYTNSFATTTLGTTPAGWANFGSSLSSGTVVSGTTACLTTRAKR